MDSTYHRTHISRKSQTKKEGNNLNVKTRVYVSLSLSHSIYIYICVCVCVCVCVYTHNKQDEALEKSLSVEFASVTDIA